MSSSRRHDSPSDPLLRRSPIYPPEPDHRSIISAISELKSDKESLKSALKSAIVKRDELTDKVMTLEEVAQTHLRRRKEMEGENERLRRENDELARKADDYRKEQSRLHTNREDDQRIIRDLADRTKLLESEVRKLTHRREASKISRETSDLIKSAALDSHFDNDILKYTQFVLDKLQDSTEVLNLFRGRVGSVRKFWGAVQEKEYGECLLKTMQFLSDWLVYRGHKPGKVAISFNEELRPLPQVTLPSPPQPAAAHPPSTKSISCQTLTDQATNTTPQTNFDFTPSFPSVYTPKRTESYAKPQRFFSEAAGGFMNTTSSSRNGEGFLSPTSVRSQYSTRGEDDYVKLMDESENLLSTLHLQSDRLVRLNSQIQQTMQESSRRTLTYSESSPSLHSRPESNVSRPATLAPGSAQPLEPVQETPQRKEDISAEADPPEAIPDIDIKLPATTSEFLAPPKSAKKPSNKQRGPKKTPLYKAYPNKTDVTLTQERVQLQLRSVEKWNSVSDFFSSGKDEETNKGDFDPDNQLSDR